MRLRLALWFLLVISWLIMLLYAWSAFATFPSQARLEQSRMTAIPTLAAFGWLVARSLLELGALLAITWPWQPRWYVRRLAAAAVLLPVWFLMTAPLTLTLMAWVHRRWLAGVELVLVGALLATLAAGLIVRRTDPRNVEPR
jgi:hypothetical protein